ncbi:MAG: hypothetical protein Kow0090_11090 [Myxococcota bacterium]
MKRNSSVAARAVIVALVLPSLLAACAGAKRDLAALSQNNPDRPKWIDSGDGFRNDKHGKAFYAVGAANLTNPQLRRDAADAQARANLARIFQSNIKSLVKIYVAETTAGDPNRSSEEQFTSEATKAFTYMDLSGAVIVERWYDPIEKVQYSLAMLDMENFQNQIGRMKELSATVRQAIQENAKKAFDELDKEAALQAK